jgi:lipopolysaccharide export system protein LptA
MTRTFLTTLVFAAAMPVMALTQGTSIGFGGGGHDASAQVEVAADSLSIDQATGRATLTGNVMIVQDTLRLTANQVDVEYGDVDGRRTIQTLLAAGDVLIVVGPDAAEGETAVYSIGSGEVVMTGNVLLTQGGNSLAGERLVVNLDTGAGTVSGRVRTVLQVSE